MGETKPNSDSILPEFGDSKIFHQRRNREYWE